MPPRFIYFDLGRVLVDFDVANMCQRVADVAGATPKAVSEAIFDNGLQHQYELGEISTKDFYEAFCQRTGTRPEFDALLEAASDIFELIPSMVPVVQSLHQAGHRLGILSNTCEAHFELCARKFPEVMELFEVYALSYQLRAFKPDPAIYLGAANLAGVSPQEIFFMDDFPEHVAAAQAAGFDAVHFTSPAKLIDDFRARGLEVSHS
jgi:putative hydrolase of the HAD superfamily